MGLVPAYGVLGLFTDRIGLHHEWEIYLFAVYYGFLVGALQSYSRVIFSELIPPGDESEFFSLYAITDKGSSWLGPLLQSLLLNATGNSRYGLLVLIAMIWVPIPIVLGLVDVDRGVQDAKTFHSSRRPSLVAPVDA
jgi:UMF1 family MFS transporter